MADGTYSGIKLVYNGQGGWTKDGRTGITHQEMATAGHLPTSGDPNPEGAWFVGGKKTNDGDWVFEKYYNGAPYIFGGEGPDLEPRPLDPKETAKNIYRYIVKDLIVWP